VTIVFKALSAVTAFAVVVVSVCLCWFYFYSGDIPIVSALAKFAHERPFCAASSLSTDFAP
jgi:hypothetical protein